MIVRCTDLDAFFDSELDTDQAAAFRDHLVTCERCQRVLHGRMQEEVAAQADDPPATEANDRPAAAHGAATAGARAPAALAGAGASTKATPGVVPRRGVLVYLAPVLAAAAALPLVCLVRPNNGPLAMDLEIEHGGKATRAEHTHGFASVGDVLRPTVRGERQRALWVYLDNRDLLVACPNDERCIERGGELAVEVKLPARGHYTVVALGSDDVIPAPTPGEKLDNVLAGQRAGVHIESSTVDVD